MTVNGKVSFSLPSPSARLNSACAPFGPEVYPRLHTLNKMLVEGYDAQLKKTGLEGYVTGIGTNGALMFSSKPVLNYRDWLEVDAELWKHYWFGMVNRGVLAQPESAAGTGDGAGSARPAPRLRAGAPGSGEVRGGRYVGQDVRRRSVRSRRARRSGE